MIHNHEVPSSILGPATINQSVNAADCFFLQAHKRNLEQSYPEKVDTILRRRRLLERAKR